MNVPEGDRIVGAKKRQPASPSLACLGRQWPAVDPLGKRLDSPPDFPDRRLANVLLDCKLSLSNLAEPLTSSSGLSPVAVESLLIYWVFQLFLGFGRILDDTASYTAA